MTESKRIDKLIHNETVNGSPVSTQVTSSILSRLFWPPFKQFDLNLPPMIERQLEIYGTGFSNIQQGRKLEWIRNLGLVSLTIELGGRISKFRVTPEQASIITVFENGSKSVDEVASTLNIDSAVARTGVLFWVNKGILRPDGRGGYVERESVDDTQELLQSEDIASGGSVQSAAARAAEEMKVYWSYIQGMLKNLGPCPVEKIHSFLKILVPADQMYSKSQEDLEQYLNLMVEDEKLEMSGNLYSLTK
jgi:anaphase-promoting complex subunit 2